ncbi:MAG: hypothetical protein AAFQ80_13680 [Cyanobacteria bacterium J06621_8]
MTLAFSSVIKSSRSLDNYLIGSAIESIRDSLTTWLVNHPVFAWIWAHPLPSLLLAGGGIILTLRLLAIIYKAIARTIDRMWIWILQAPWRLLKLIFAWETKPLAIATQTKVKTSPLSPNSEQLQSILERLEMIEQQQQQIIQELAELRQQPLTK